ncbi:hypothetical protein SAMN06296036_108199 [Pseudobacteriovorax antillogorgiicola]|uniref:N-acetyltransferase domain-containing protein n=1 Tax=Pseudobacteriovorax antillogorgiicola TaxID=1513793 RepID=A0A1Y6BSP5_9BACT|nr:GNAT family N-acetyltransferase [Pseudobacteriovorax antillogorgiicola]TCS52997.1 acetyltransferase (GNAT) family protein [Pseudobacteriovorax antillogorgiicola]SMF27159.1 hypothetical protein SAMN06296036_108199 [Pseudobacteriovorax antillogorgiicola]
MKQNKIQRLTESDLPIYRQLLALFAKEFDENETYLGAQPSDTYARTLLGNEDVIFLVEQKESEVIGGLVAYVLRKFEQERSELYIYDLAVRSESCRQGVATRLIENLHPHCQCCWCLGNLCTSRPW